ncbi:MAG: hypothetical protein K8I02_01835, partial [Candidatus Methylomirabilis sp.]|nr:hypothetical protein [Deltaproteobacteria bacterium]
PGAVRADGHYSDKTLSKIIKAGKPRGGADREALARADRKELARALDAAVVNYSAFRKHGGRPAPSEARRTLKKIETASERFLEALEALAVRGRHSARNRASLALLLRAHSYRDELAAPLFTAMTSAEFFRLRKREPCSLDDLCADFLKDFEPETILADAALNVQRIRDGAARAAERAGSKVGAKGKAVHQGARDVRGFAWELASIYERFTGRGAKVSRTPDAGRVGGPAVRFIVACLTPPLRERGEEIPTPEEVREFLRQRKKRGAKGRGKSASEIF